MILFKRQEYIEFQLILDIWLFLRFDVHQ